MMNFQNRRSPTCAITALISIRLVIRKSMSRSANLSSSSIISSTRSINFLLVALTTIVLFFCKPKQILKCYFHTVMIVLHDLILFLDEKLFSHSYDVHPNKFRP